RTKREEDRKGLSVWYLLISTRQQTMDSYRAQYKIDKFSITKKIKISINFYVVIHETSLHDNIH
ncbi:unnamed protein product, partial [Heterotrigona itama]